MIKKISLFGVILGTLTALAETEPVKVVVTGGNTNPYAGGGLYVEYTINGTVYRSNEVGQKINDFAWANMSYVDKNKVADYYGTYIGRRKTDFGCADEIAKLCNDRNGITAAQEALKQKWIETDFPGYAERFHPDNRDEYFETHLTPDIDCSISSLRNDYPQIYEKYLELQFDFACACEGYDALERFNSLRHQYAVEFISKELIQIIIDQVLMPNITVSGVGTMAAKINNAILDHRDNITKLAKAIKDKDLNLQNESADTRNRMELYNAMLDENKSLIQTAMHAAQSMKTEIENSYASAKAARDTQLAAVKAADNARRQEVESVRVDGVPNEEIVARNEADAQDLENKEATERRKHDFYEAICSEYGRNSTEAYSAWASYVDATNAVAAKELEIAKKQAELYDSCVVRMRDWYEGYRSSYCNLTNSYPSGSAEELDFPVGSRCYQAYTSLLDGGKIENFADMSDSDAAQVKSAVHTHVSNLTTGYANVKTWQISMNAHSREARGAYDTILSDYHSLTNTFNDWGVYCKEYESDGYPASIFIIAADFLRWVGSFEPVDSTEDYWANKKKTVESRLDYFDEQRQLYKDAKAADYATFNALMADRDLAIVSFYNAYAAVSNLVETAPDYIRDQNADYGILSISPSSVLGQMFLGPSHTGTVQDAHNIRNALLAFKLEYENRRTQMDHAATAIRLLDSELSHYRWTVEGTSAYYDSAAFIRPDMTPAMYAYGNVVTGLCRDFSWENATGVLLECCQELYTNRTYYATRGVSDSAYMSLKGRVESALQNMGYNTMVLQPLSQPLRLSPCLYSPSYSSYTYSLNGYIPWTNDLYTGAYGSLISGIEADRADLTDFTFPVTADVDASVTNHWRALSWHDKYSHSVPSNIVVRIATERKDEIFIDATGCIPTILGLDEPEWKGTVRISGTVESTEALELRGRIEIDDNAYFDSQVAVKDGAVVKTKPCGQFAGDVVFEAGSTLDVQLEIDDDSPWGPPTSFNLTTFPAKPTLSDGAHLLVNGVEQGLGDWEFNTWGQASWKGTAEKPSVTGDGDAVVTGAPYTGYEITPGEWTENVVVSIPEGLSPSKVTVVVNLGNASTVKPSGANIRVMNYSEYTWSDVDITDLVDLPAPDAGGTIDLSGVKVKDEIVNEVFDPAHGAEVDFSDPSWPIVRIAPTRLGLVYHFSEGASLDTLVESYAIDGNGYSEPYELYITVRGGSSAFYSIRVTP